MPPSGHPPASRRPHGLPVLRSLILLLPPLTAFALMRDEPSHLGSLPASGDLVMRRMTSSMPRLDVGVRQAVHVTFAEFEKPAVGMPAQLRVVLTSGAAEAEVEVRAIAPVGATVTGGLTLWSGRLAYQEVVEIPVAVVLPGDQGAFVRAEVTTRLPDGQTFQNATSVFVDPGTPDSPAPESRTLVGPNGEPIPVVITKNPNL